LVEIVFVERELEVGRAELGEDLARGVNRPLCSGGDCEFAVRVSPDPAARNAVVDEPVLELKILACVGRDEDGDAPLVITSFRTRWFVTTALLLAAVVPRPVIIE
jgi:hypothetical protein